MLIKDAVAYLDKRFPLEDAEEFDRGALGLAIGDETIPLRNILLALDLNGEVIAEALMKDCNLIITHHPFLFHPIQKVIFTSEKGSTIKKMCEHNLALYSMHTNLDVATGGVNDTLAQLLGIKNPKTINGNPGKGNYLRYGTIEPLTLRDLAFTVKKIFRLDGVRVLGNCDRIIQKVGIVGGAGAHESDIAVAERCGLDCYITGEVKLSAAQTADYHNLALIEVKHGVEKNVLVPIGEELRKQFVKEHGYDGEIFVSVIETDKMVYL